MVYLAGRFIAYFIENCSTFNRVFFALIDNGKTNEFDSIVRVWNIKITSFASHDDEIMNYNLLGKLKIKLFQDAKRVMLNEVQKYKWIQLLFLPHHIMVLSSSRKQAGKSNHFWRLTTLQLLGAPSFMLTMLKEAFSKRLQITCLMLEESDHLQLTLLCSI